MKKRGFTLVELSIVLVIIGLLIGGILVGQSLIGSSKLNAFVRQLQGYDIAVNNFKQKYKSLPGDSKNFGGDGDGYITDTVQRNDNFEGEISNFWASLSQTELPNVKYSNIDINKLQPGKNAPIVKYGRETTIIGLTHCTLANSACTSVGFVFPIGTHLWLVRRHHLIGDHLYAAGATEDSTPLSAMDAFSIDTKIDDGSATAGMVRASNGERSGFEPTARNSGCVQTDVTKYDASFEPDETHCALAIKMLSQIGQGN